MGYSISAETHERMCRSRAEDRLCQGTGRCSSRATYVVVFTSSLNGPNSTDDGLSTFVMCKKHMTEFFRTFDYYGYCFDNDRESRIVGGLKMRRDDHGSAARTEALVGARAHLAAGLADHTTYAGMSS